MNHDLKTNLLANLQACATRPLDEAARNLLATLGYRSDRVLQVRANDVDADVSAWEAEIDRLVYELYGLAEEEIQIVEEQ